MTSTPLPSGFPRNATPSPGIPRNATPNPTVGEAVRTSEEIGAEAERTEKYVAQRRAQADEEGRQLLAKTQIRGGAQKISPKSMKGEALLGRNDNIKSKMNFKVGAHARTDPNGGSTKAAQKKNGRKQS